MDEETFRLFSIFVQLLLPIVTFLGLYIAARLSIDAYFKQKWWDRKSNVYEELLERLYNARIEADNYLGALGLENQNTYQDAYGSAIKEAIESMDRARLLHSHLFSPKTIKILDKLTMNMVRARNIRNPEEKIKGVLEALKLALDELKRLQLEDLQVSKPKPFWKPF